MMAVMRMEEDDLIIGGKRERERVPAGSSVTKQHEVCGAR